MIQTPEKLKHYLLRIELRHAHRPIWREVEVPSRINLKHLHEVIQRVMGWRDAHLHKFTFKGKHFSDAEMSDDLEPEDGDEEAVALDDLLKRARQKLEYTYDFGDDWQHSVTLRKQIKDRTEPVVRCTAGEGAAPLEDCGGVGGHEMICESLANPAAGLDADWNDWVPEDYDPDAFDPEEANQRLAPLEAYLREVLEFGPAGGEADAGASVAGTDGAGEEDDEEAPPDPYKDLESSQLSDFAAALDEARALCELEPWNDLYDRDIFCIEDPETGLVDLISILGAGGEIHAVHVHRPPESYLFWQRSLFGDLPGTIEDYLAILHALEAEFVGKADLEPPDRTLYERTAAPQPPKNAAKWVKFRRYHPRRPPWFAPHEELPALRRGLRLARRYVGLLRSATDRSAFAYDRPRDDTDNPPADLPGFRLIEGRPPEKAESWELTRIPIDWDQGVREPYTPGEFELERLRSLPLGGDAWEAGALYLNPVMTGEGPVIPIVAALLPLSDTVPMPEPAVVTDPEVPPDRALWEHFFQQFLSADALPKEVRVTTDLAGQTLAPLAELGVRVVRCDRFEKLDEFFQYITGQFS